MVNWKTYKIIEREQFEIHWFFASSVNNDVALRFIKCHHGCDQWVSSEDFPTSTEQFDGLSRNYSAENEIKRYVESQNHYNGIVLEQRIEIAPKSEYRMS